MAKKKQAEKKPPITADEKARIRALKLVDHTFAIAKDEFGRDRLAQTATASREYDIGSMKSVVRVRDVDPLKGISSLTWQQQKAGRMYREDYEICAREGLKPASWEMNVDGSSEGRKLPERIADAHANIASANEALGYPQIVRVIEAVCGMGMSLKSIAMSAKAANIEQARKSASLLLSMGLQRLAVHYGIVSHPKRIDTRAHL